MRTDQTRWADLILFISVLFGAIVRFVPTIFSGSTINDGGMFYVMIRDLELNHFLIPALTSYNHQNIPFAYPPLSFYLGGLLNSLGIQLIDLMRWLPPALSTIAIFTFYYMASQILNSSTKASLATLAYALMPRTFSWYVMGGGLSRTLAVIFLLLTCATCWILLSKHEKKYILFTALFGAGAVLSHPETGLHTAATCALIWFIKGRTAKGLREAVYVMVGVIVLTSPWWGTVIARSGVAPFLSALHTGGHDSLFWLPWITFSFSEERFVTLIAALGLTGLLVQCTRRDWFLPAWLLMPFIVEPRSATAIAALPLAILAGIGLSDFLIPNIINIRSGAIDMSKDWTVYMADNRVVRIVIGYVLFSLLIGSLTYDFSLARYIVPPQSRIAMDWVVTHTPADSTFIVLTGSEDPFSDPVAEWFPAFTSRTSQNTLQGKEWLLGSNFMIFHEQIGLLQSCLNDEPSCVEKWANVNKTRFDYIYLEKSLDRSVPVLLLHDLRLDPRYALVYENDAVVIFGQK